ncbi:acyl carrier protein [Streptomyces sp. NPDC007983]|uniref:acyl carrier protein n=1 Tax=Streptomyces sp. NPDC007983 TaxID=3364800 RepID=UPI0036E7C97B
MATFTQSDLVRLLREAAGEDESISLDGDIVETSFADLGYDSLALLELASRVEGEFGVSPREEALAEAETPRQFVALVNELLSTPA